MSLKKMNEFFKDIDVFDSKRIHEKLRQKPGYDKIQYGGFQSLFGQLGEAVDKCFAPHNIRVFYGPIVQLINWSTLVINRPSITLHTNTIMTIKVGFGGHGASHVAFHIAEKTFGYRMSGQGFGGAQCNFEGCFEEFQHLLGLLRPIITTDVHLEYLLCCSYSELQTVITPRVIEKIKDVDFFESGASLFSRHREYSWIKNTFFQKYNIRVFEKSYVNLLRHSNFDNGNRYTDGLLFFTNSNIFLVSYPYGGNMCDQVFVFVPVNSQFVAKQLSGLTVIDCDGLKVCCAQFYNSVSYCSRPETKAFEELLSQQTILSNSKLNLNIYVDYLLARNEKEIMDIFGEEVQQVVHAADTLSSDIVELKIQFNSVTDNQLITAMKCAIQKTTAELGICKELLNKQELDIITKSSLIAQLQSAAVQLNTEIYVLQLQLTARTTEMESLKQLLDDQQAAINENAILKSRIKYLERLLD